MTSKSCTPQSRNMPPETATYSGVGGSGSSVVDRIVLTQPSSPLTTAARAAAMAASYRRWKPIWTGTGEASGRRTPGRAGRGGPGGAAQRPAPRRSGLRHGLLAQRRQARLDAGEDEVG